MLYGGLHSPGPSLNSHGLRPIPAPLPLPRIPPHTPPFMRPMSLPSGAPTQLQQAHQGGWRLEEGLNFTPPPRPREPSGGAALFQHRLRHGSSCMEPAELDLILRIQWKSLHMRSALPRRLLLPGGSLCNIMGKPMPDNNRVSKGHWARTLDITPASSPVDQLMRP